MLTRYAMHSVKLNIRMLCRRVLPLALALAALYAGEARADIVLMKKGERLEGVVAATPGRPDTVSFRNSKTVMEIPKDMIQAIQYESEAVNLRRMGDQYYNAKRYKDAFEAYQKSLALNPNDAVTSQQLGMARDALTRETSLERRKQMEAVEVQMANAKKLAEEKKFEDAEKILLSVLPALRPTDEQLTMIFNQKKEFYRAWAHEADDKLKPELASRYYEKVLELDPNDKEAYERLLKVSEKMPERSARVIEAYRVQLKLNPKDSITRRKLADKLLEEGFRMDREGGNNAESRRKVEENMKEALDLYDQCAEGAEKTPSTIVEQKSRIFAMLYRRAELAGDLDAATRFYQQLSEVSDKTDPKILRQMEYRKELKRLDPSGACEKLSPEAVEALVQLTQKSAKQWELKAQAKETFGLLFKKYPEHPAVVKARSDAANALLLEASNAAHEFQYAKSMQLAGQCQIEYADVQDAKARAEQIYNLSKTKVDEANARQFEDMKKYKEQGDRDYMQGMQHLQQMVNSQVKDNVIAYSPQQEAVTSFRRAEANYTRALQSAPLQDRESRDDITQRLADTQAKLRILTNPVPPKFSVDKY